MEKSLEEMAEAIWRKGVKAVDPAPAVFDFLTLNPALAAALNKTNRLLVIGGGKACAAMALGLERFLLASQANWQGQVNVPEGNYPSLKKIMIQEVRPVGENQPTPKAVLETRRMLSLVENSQPGDGVICLLSGGGSALLVSPVASISLEEKRLATALLSLHGATINELNCVRKHLSEFKGGRLGETFVKSPGGKGLFLGLVLSDVVGDPLDVIASGPAVPDPTTFADAHKVIQSHGLIEKLPASVMNHLRLGMEGKIAETPKEGWPNFETHLIGNNAKALGAAVQAAVDLGFDVINLGPGLAGATTDAASLQMQAQESAIKFRHLSGRPLCLLSGGETTVDLGPNPGKGGRNQEMALEMLVLMSQRGLRNCVYLAGGTDGEDGPTDAAGAFAHKGIWEKALVLGLEPGNFLQRHDSYSFFEKAGGLFKPGPTGTNVMDLRILLCR